MPRKLTNADFECDGRRVHGDRYDYSRVDYKNAHGLVIIICKVTGHTPFEQSRHNHITKGHGCIECANLIRYAVQE